jgi:catechol 2,3-dioxygenase-like lactoylglutathione lyase family enzyme
MHVRNIRWVGVPTEAHSAMSAFLTDVLGLEVGFDDGSTAEFRTLEGDTFQIMAPGHDYYGFFSAQAHGPVPLFEGRRRRGCSWRAGGSGVEIVGEPGHDSQWSWINFRAPDGNLYELASRTRR